VISPASEHTSGPPAPRYWKNHLSDLRPHPEQRQPERWTAQPGRDYTFSDFSFCIGSSAAILQHASAWIEYTHSSLVLTTARPGRMSRTRANHTTGPAWALRQYSCRQRAAHSAVDRNIHCVSGFSTRPGTAASIRLTRRRSAGESSNVHTRMYRYDPTQASDGAFQTDQRHRHRPGRYVPGTRGSWLTPIWLFFPKRKGELISIDAAYMLK